MGIGPRVGACLDWRPMRSALLALFPYVLLMAAPGSPSAAPRAPTPRPHMARDCAGFAWYHRVTNP